MTDIVQLPTLERVADDMRLLKEAALPGEWGFRAQRALKRHIDGTGKKLVDLSVGEVLHLAMLVRIAQNVNPDPGLEDDDVG
jgi:hypothetical protein